MAAAAACVITLTMNPAVDVATRVAVTPAPGKLRCAPPHHDPGGGGIQVARVIHRMGGAVRAVFPAGGATGARLAALLQSENVPVFTIEAQAETRECFNVLDTGTGQLLRFVLPGEPLLEREWRDCLERVTEQARTCKWVVASGSLPPGVPSDFYARLAARGHGRAGRLVLDAPPQLAALALREGGLGIVRGDDELLRELAGAPLESEDALVAAAQSIVASGACEMLAITRGEAGALLVTRTEVLRAGAIPGACSDTVGAGSSFVAGLVQALAGGKHLRRAFATAVAAGAAARLAPGGIADAWQIERLLEQVWIR